MLSVSDYRLMFSAFRVQNKVLQFKQKKGKGNQITD